jgi:hypothetical protein
MNRNHVFDSNGPDMRLRGTAQQLFEKYLQLGRDATGSGDRVMAESYFQHAEHYFRILNAMSQASQQQGGPSYQQQRRYQNGPEQDGDGTGDQPELGREGGVVQMPVPAHAHGNGHALDGESDSAADQRDRSEQRDN